MHPGGGTDRGMKVVGVIPARWGSTRLPGKSLIPLCGKPLVRWVMERAAQARRLNELVVATDDARIRDAVQSWGGRAVMTSPNHGSGTERAAEAVAGRGADVVINIQGDEPLIDPGLIDKLAEVMLGDADCAMATAAAPIRDPDEVRNPSVTKVVCGAAGQALYFSRCPIPFVRDGDMADAGTLHWRHIGIYAYRSAFLERLVSAPPCVLERAEKLEQLRALFIGARIRVVPTESAGLGVDTPQDVAAAEAQIRRLGLA